MSVTRDSHQSLTSMDNSSISCSGSSQSNSGGGINTGNAVAVVALVVSIVALAGTIMQVLQQYYASAAGYSNCGESVIGDWSKRRKRIFRPSELRFEVQFEAPVIFVCQPTNEDGPLAKVKICYINGTENSLAETRTRLESQDDRQAQAQLSSKERIATADNERASWLMLLNELQRMEKDSMTFEQEEYRKSPLRQRQQPDWDKHTLAVALQIKPRSWDTMPSNVKKPYATTTMCHMIEMTAMLGMHWKAFNSSADKYRAEGNGCVVTGAKVDDLGIMFSFQIYGKRTFKENRLIPSDYIKEYCFGFVPTIWRDTNDSRRLDGDENPRDLSVMQLASRQEMAETLTMIGCNTNTSNYVLSKQKKDRHLFPSMSFSLPSSPLFSPRPSCPHLPSLFFPCCRTRLIWSLSAQSPSKFLAHSARRSTLRTAASACCPTQPTTTGTRNYFCPPSSYRSTANIWPNQVGKRINLVALRGWVSASRNP